MPGRLLRISLTAVAVIAGAAALPSGEARADTESAKLEKYRPKIEGSVTRALEFLAQELAANRAGDGTFIGKHGKTNAVAGLVGMAFLSKGYLPSSGPHSLTIGSCIDYVLATPAKKGYLGVRGGRMYGHGIATLFLSEVSGMVGPERQKKIDDALPKALRVILDAQKVRKNRGEDRGGWRYEPTENSSDISVTSWQVMALRSARLNGAPVPGSAIKDAVAFIDRCKSPYKDGGFFYAVPLWYKLIFAHK